MVHLTMTEAMVAALQYCSSHGLAGWPLNAVDGDPSLETPSPGKPISHGQIVDLSRCLRRNSAQHEGDASGVNIQEFPKSSLNELLRGSRVYIEPAKPRAESTSEYKALMAHLRREEEAKIYEQMINPTHLSQSNKEFTQNTLETRSAYSQAQEEEDEITFTDINRQMALIINVLLSIIACSVAIWMAASHWSTAKRLGLSMSGSGIVGIAEVAIYAGYLRRIKESKKKEKGKVEVKQITDTWVIEKNGEKGDEDSVKLEDSAQDSRDLRRRKARSAT